MARNCNRCSFPVECRSGGGKLLLLIVLSGCAATEPETEQVRVVDVLLPSGELKQNVRVLAEEDTVTSKVDVVCRTWRAPDVKVSGRRYPGWSQEYCASPAYWASRPVSPKWIHVESGIAELPGDERECRTKANRWGSRSHRGKANTTYETVYNNCMESKGYSLFSID